MSSSLKQSKSKSPSTHITIRQSKAINASIRDGGSKAKNVSEPPSAEDPFDIVVPPKQRGQRSVADFRRVREYAVELLAESIYANSSSLALVAYDVAALSIILAVNDNLLIHVRPYCDTVRGPRIVAQSVVPPHSHADVGLDDDAMLVQGVTGRKWQRAEEVETLNADTKRLISNFTDVPGVSAGYRRIILPDVDDCVAANDADAAIYGDGLDVAATLLRMCRRTAVTALETLYGERPYLVERFEVDQETEPPLHIVENIANARDDHSTNNIDVDDNEGLGDTDANTNTEVPVDVNSDDAGTHFVSSINLVDLIDEDKNYNNGEPNADSGGYSACVGGVGSTPYTSREWYTPAEVILGFTADNIAAAAINDGGDTNNVNIVNDDREETTGSLSTPILVRRTGCYAADTWDNALLWCGIPSNMVPKYEYFPETLGIDGGDCGSCPGGTRTYYELEEALPSIDGGMKHLLSLSCTWEGDNNTQLFYRVSRKCSDGNTHGARQALRRSEPMLAVDALRCCGAAVRNCVLNTNSSGGWSVTFELHGVVGSIERESLVSRLVVQLDCFEMPIVAAYSYPVMSSLQNSFPGDPSDQTLQRIASELVELLHIAVIPAVDGEVQGSILVEERLLAREDGVRQTWVNSYDFATRKLPLDKANANSERWYVARVPEAQWDRLKGARRQPKLKGLLYTTSTYDTCDSSGHIHRDAVLAYNVDVTGYVPVSIDETSSSIWNFDDDSSRNIGEISRYDHLTRDGAIRLGRSGDIIPDASNVATTTTAMNSTEHFSSGSVIRDLIERINDIWNFDKTNSNDNGNDTTNNPGEIIGYTGRAKEDNEK